MIVEIAEVIAVEHTSDHEDQVELIPNVARFEATDASVRLVLHNGSERVFPVDGLNGAGVAIKVVIG